MVCIQFRIFVTPVIISDRKQLDEPVEKIATRNMFYDENEKHVPTKKEILDEAGQLRSGCKIIPKGEVYERNIFTIKDSRFKSDRQNHHYRNDRSGRFKDISNNAKLLYGLMLDWIGKSVSIFFTDNLFLNLCDIICSCV